MMAMKKNFKIISLLLFSLTCYDAAAQNQDRLWTNPVITPDMADPTVIWSDTDSCYLSLATSGRSQGTWWKSCDMFTWENTGRFPFSKETHLRLKEFGQMIWAPQLYRIGSEFRLYLTLYNAREDCRIAVLKSASLKEEFEFAGIVTDSKVNGIPDTIDPSIIREESTGKLWMVFGSTGGMHIQQLSDDGLRMAEGSKAIPVAGRSVEQDPTRQSVYEGSYVYYRDGFYYLFISRGNYWDHTYGILVGRSRSVTGPYVDKDGVNMKAGGGSVLLHSDEGDVLFGPGHNGEIMTDSSGRTFLPYHCHDSRAEKPGLRPMCVQELLWGKDGWPYFEGGKPQTVNKY